MRDRSPASRTVYDLLPKSEYDACRVQEDRFWKKHRRLDRRGLTQEQAQQLVAKVCQMLAMVFHPVITFVAGDLRKHTSCFRGGLRYGQDYRGDIVLLQQHNATWVVLHELTHYVCHVERVNEGDGEKSYHHGPGFLDMEQLVWEAFLEIRRQEEDEQLQAEADRLQALHHKKAAA